MRPVAWPTRDSCPSPHPALASPEQLKVRASGVRAFAPQRGEGEELKAMPSRRGFAALFAKTMSMSGARHHSAAAREAKIKVDG
jgi:hypothetical protein